MNNFLPINFDEGKKYYKNFEGFDVIFISGDPYYDHPLSGTALLSRLLQKKGYKIGIIPQPINDKDYISCGSPKYFFCITSGLLDSILANYTPMLKKRENVLVPERALMIYSQKAKQLHKGSMTVIGGVEATIRRFTHFDYKENKLRRGILNDTKADILLFGNAERSLLDLLDRLKKINFDGKNFSNVKEKLELQSLDGAAYRIKKKDIKENIRKLPSFEECFNDKKKFSLLTRITYLLPDDNFIEKCGVGQIMHNKPTHPLIDEEMDYIYDIEFTRQIHPKSKNYEMNKGMVKRLEDSIILGRGCWGSCNFCIIPLVQGKNIAKRSKESILKEIESLYVKGVKKINDLTLPTLNMYGSSCTLYNKAEIIYSHIIKKNITVYNKTEYCNQECVGCKFRKINDNLIPLLESVDKLNKKYGSELELRSAIRHDIILNQKKLFRKIMQFIKRLKIAPEHISDNVLKQMNKATKKDFEKFLKEYKKVNKEQKTDKRLVPYIVAAHPGCTKDDMKKMKKFCNDNDIFINLTQVFTPTPGTASTSMYYTGENPLTRKNVYVPRTFREKKDQKNIMFKSDNDIIDNNG